MQSQAGMERAVGEDPLSRKKRTTIVIGAAAGGAAVTMTVFELVKQILAPEITRWESHYITIVFVTALSMVTAYVVERQRERISRRNELFRIIADFTYDWEYWLAPDDRFQYVSPSCRRVTGYDGREFLLDPDHFRRIIHEADREKAVPLIYGLKDYEKPIETEFRIVCPDGTIRWIGHVSQPVSGPGKQRIGRRASNRDITKRKTTELNLRQSEDLYRQTARNLPDSVVCVVDREMRFLIAEGKLIETAELNPKDLEGCTPREVLPEQVSSLLEPRFSLAFQGQTVEDEVHLHERSFWSKYVPIQDSKTTTTGAMALIVDITERKKGRELVRQGEVLDQVRDAIVAIDNECIIRYVNRAVFTQYELDPTTPIVGSSLGEYYQFEWMSKDQKDQAYSSLDHSGNWNGINVHVTGKGNRLWVESTVSVVRDTNGNQIGMVAVMRDTTKRKQLEDECTQTSLDLATANEELEAFSYSVSHDLRAPLRTMKSFSDFLLEDYAESLDEIAQDYLIRIAHGADKMNAIIEDMLSLSRISRGEMSREPTDLSALVREYFDDFTAGAPQRRTELIVQPNISAYADPRLLRIALENLLRNAWKFTSNNEVTRIEFGTIKRDEHEVFFVRDNGAGFSSDLAENIFEAFTRGHTDREFQGTGIGLSIVRRVITRHGGEVWAEGAVGRGATFYFTLG